MWRGAASAAAQAFKDELGPQLKALGIPTATQTQVWVIDEALFGLHTETRKVWITIGVRPLVRRQTRYD